MRNVRVREQGPDDWPRMAGGIEMDVVVQMSRLLPAGETVRSGEVARGTSGDGSNRTGAQPALPRRTEVEGLLLRGERS